MAKSKKSVIDITPKQENAVSKELVSHIQDKNLPVAIQQDIIEIMSPVFLQLTDWDTKIESIEIVDENDKSGMLIAAESRKYVKSARIDIKKQVDEKIALIKDDMQPYLDNIEGWKTVFSFAEAVMKNIESKALDKEKYAEKLKQQRIANLRNSRAAIVEPLKQYVGYSIDLGIMSEEEFEKLVNLAKLAKKADDDEKIKAKEEEDKRAQELEREKLYNNRIHLLYSLGMKKGENVFYYDTYQISEDIVKDAPDFDLLFAGIESKVNKIKEEEKAALESEQAKAKELAEKAEAERQAENLRLQKEAEEAKKKADEKRNFINSRISEVLGAVIKQDGLYVKYEDDAQTTNKVIDYEDIYNMTQEGWYSFVTNQNNYYNEYNESIRAWREEQNNLRIKAEAEALAEKNRLEAEAQAQRQEDLKAKVQAEMSDKEKVSSLLKEIELFSKKVSSEFNFSSELGNTIKNNVLLLLGKIISWVKEKQ